MYDDEGPLFQDSEESTGVVPTTPIAQPEMPEVQEDPVTLDFIPAFQVFPVMKEEQLVYLALQMRTATFTQDNNRTPLNVCLVIDQSSSMRGEKLYAIKNAARLVVDQLTVADYFSL